MADDDQVLREALDTVVTVGAEMNRRVVSIGERVAAMSRLADSATAEHGTAAAGEQPAVLDRLGRDLDGAASGLAVDVEALRSAVASIDGAMVVILRAADALGRADLPDRVEANTVLTSFVRLCDPANGGAGAVRLLEQVLGQAEAAPEPLRGACRQVRAQLRLVVGCYGRIEEWGSAAGELLVPPDVTTL